MRPHHYKCKKTKGLGKFQLRLMLFLALYIYISLCLYNRYDGKSILSPTEGWMVTGGYRGYDYLDSTEKISKGNFVSGESVWNFCTFIKRNSVTDS